MKRSVFILVLILGILAGTVCYGTIRNQGMAPAPDYPKNSSGETYGSALEAISPETEPDLIKAMGEDGTIGYVRKTDLEEELPSTPEEALEKQAQAGNGKEILLYDVDGKKVIGKFKIETGVAEKKE